MNRLPSNRVLVGDVRERLAEIPDASIDCVITSPPYFQMRDYGRARQMGLEESVEGWVEELRLAARGLARVLKPSGSLWLNLGDTYSRHPRFGGQRKSLLLGPERLLLVLAEDGWIVRNKVIWFKTKHLPHSVTDRLTNAYEVVYFLTRSQRYFFDLDAIRVPHHSTSARRRATAYPPASVSAPLWRQRGGGNDGLTLNKGRGIVGHPLGKNPGDVWPLATSDYSGSHFATFPPKLVEPPLLATCPELICDVCGTPFRRLRRPRPATRPERGPVRRYGRMDRGQRTVRPHESEPLLPGCRCAASARPGVVLDPFFGAGTVGLVAEQHGRDWIGIELNPAYAKLAERRLAEARHKRAPDGPAVDETESAVASTEQPSISERSEP